MTYRERLGVILVMLSVAFLLGWVFLVSTYLSSPFYGLAYLRWLIHG